MSKSRSLRRRELLIAAGGVGAGSFWLARTLTGGTGGARARLRHSQRGNGKDYRGAITLGVTP